MSKIFTITNQASATFGSFRDKASADTYADDLRRLRGIDCIVVEGDGRPVRVKSEH